MTAPRPAGPGVPHSLPSAPVRRWPELVELTPVAADVHEGAPADGTSAAGVMAADAFEGRNGRPHGSGGTLFGGQLVAQALRAAGHTVAPERLPHALHATFLRPGRAEHPVRYRVERIRDGRAASARLVRAEQEGRPILTMLAGFKVPEAGATFDPSPGPPDVPPPEACPPVAWDELIELREVSGARVGSRRESSVDRLCDVAWARVQGPLPDDALVHRCALAFLADLGSGFATLGRPGLPPGGPSLDHSVWFHDGVRADDWVLVDLRPLIAGDGRGTYLGHLRDRRGHLGALVGQELLLRP